MILMIIVLIILAVVLIIVYYDGLYDYGINNCDDENNNINNISDISDNILIYFIIIFK